MTEFEYQERFGQADAFFRALRFLPQPHDTMFNVGKLHDAYRLLQTLVNMSALERVNNCVDEAEPEPEVIKESTNLNSILDDDNAVTQVKFQGAVSEYQELKKLLGKRQRKTTTAETVWFNKRSVRPKYDHQSQDSVKDKLMQAFMESCQMVQNPSPESILQVFKTVLTKTLLQKECLQQSQIDQQELFLCKLLLEIEPSVWFRFATFWVYTTYMKLDQSAFHHVLSFCVDQLTSNVNLALHDQTTFQNWLQFLRSVPEITPQLTQSCAQILNQIKPTQVQDLWPVLLQPQNQFYFKDQIKSQLLSDLQNPHKLNAVLMCLKNTEIIKQFKQFALTQLEQEQNVSQVQLFIATHRDQPESFKLFLDKCSEEFYSIGVQQFDLPVEKAINYIQNDRLLPHLVRHYHNDPEFRTQLINHATRLNKFEHLVYPVCLLEFVPQELHISIFKCYKVVLQDQFQYLEVGTIGQLLEDPALDILQKQVQLCTLTAAQSFGITVLQKLKPCRVWMRLCLLLASVQLELCNIEVKRILELQVWNSDLWDSLRPGLIIYCLKQPDFRATYLQMVPQQHLEQMRKESKKFGELFN